MSTNKVELNTMQYRHRQLLFILILCLFILADETKALRLRMPVLRLSATFSRTTSYVKKKLHLNDNKVVISDQSSTLKVPPTVKNKEF